MKLLSIIACPAYLALSLFTTGHASEVTYDLVIYGGTSAGIAAAVQAKRMGKTVVVIEPSLRVGGLTTGGLGQTDIGNKAAIGGIAREFYQAIKRHYDRPEAWKWQTALEYSDGGQSRTLPGDDARWTFEPSAALSVFQGWIADLGLEVVYGERLNRAAGVGRTTASPPSIESIRMESGRLFRGRMFIDATYEGDLLAAAKISYTVGREANSEYRETLNGVQVAQAKYHQLVKGISPYINPADPTSGRLPHLDPQGPGEDGSGDRRVQAYCFRMCLTDHPDNRIPFHKPEGYHELWYELLFRNFEAGETGQPWVNSPMPNRKTDTNNRLGFSIDFIGQNYAYPEASYAEREAIIARHRLYQQGLMWTLANHPRIPESIRAEASRWGVTKDEFVEGQGWQDQLYIREARRMVGAYVMTQHHCQGREVAPDPVGLAAYTMDSHNVQRTVDASGQVRNEGDVQVGGFPPYPIGLGAILPRESECTNLVVPVCLSASHIAFGSIRMEPVFMVLGQSAATVALHAIEEKVPVQKIDRPRLHTRLAADRQVLVWTAPRKP
ncbi:MAG: FAD-dependent oxidoreductase [Opitutaceae bacterium]|nr:FAD-dependent oxidoreductase [Opitutaceae bacterium]